MNTFKIQYMDNSLEKIEYGTASGNKFYTDRTKLFPLAVNTPEIGVDDLYKFNNIFGGIIRNNNIITDFSHLKKDEKYLRNWTLLALERYAKKDFAGNFIESFGEWDIIWEKNKVYQKHMYTDEIIWEMDSNSIFKHFWLFYFVAFDFWDRYPEYVYMSNPRIKISISEIESTKQSEFKRMKNTLEEAGNNYEEVKTVHKLIKAKKAEGSYWEELDEVAKKCRISE